MAKIGLSEGFTLIPKGTHVFKIVEVKYKEDFGKMEIIMQLASGQKHTERFSLLNADGEPNQGGLNAFSYFAKTALNDYTLTEIDHYVCSMKKFNAELTAHPEWYADKAVTQGVLFYYGVALRQN